MKVTGASSPQIAAARNGTERVSQTRPVPRPPPRPGPDPTNTFEGVGRVSTPFLFRVRARARGTGSDSRGGGPRQVPRESASRGGGVPPKRSCAFGREAPLCGWVRCRRVHGPNMPLRHTPRDQSERSGGRAVDRKIEIAGFAGFSENAARPRNGPAAFSTVRQAGPDPASCAASGSGNDQARLSRSAPPPSRFRARPGRRCTRDRCGRRLGAPCCPIFADLTSRSSS